MGGGTAVRAAAKVAGIGVFNGSLRSGENPVASAARKASRSVAAAVSSSSDDLKQAIANNNDSNADSSVQKPYVELDDWEFAGYEDQLYMESGEPMPRLIFGGAPTIQEAKEATSELKNALEMTYLSPNSDGLMDSFVSAQEQELLLPSESVQVETKPCLVSDVSVASSAPKHAVQAFRLLHKSPAAQNVVASIACDPNVWNAVLQNKELVDFLQSHKTSVAFPDTDPSEKDSSVSSQSQSPRSVKHGEEANEYESSPPGKGFMSYLEEVKQKISATVVDMMNSLSDTFQNFFAGPVKGEYSVNQDGTAGISVERATIGAVLTGLAVMVVMVVVLKRA